MSELSPKTDRNVVIKRQEAILSVLRQSGEPMSIAAIAKALTGNIHERTCRRDLDVLVQKGLVLREGKTKDTRYLARSVTGMSVKASEGAGGALVFSEVAQVVLAQIRKPRWNRTPVSYQAEWVNSYQPDESQWFSRAQQELMANAGKRLPNSLESTASESSASEMPAGTYGRKILNRLLIDLSFNSSRLEGNTYSALDTQKLILDGIANPDKLDAERVMILNHKDAIKFLVEKAERLKPDFETITTLHYLLSDGLLRPEAAGKVREVGVLIGESVYLPWEGRERLANQLRIILGIAEKIRNPFEQSIFLLAQIAYLQPFEDVNKRTSRLAANISLIQKNLVPLSFTEVDKDDYISAVLSVYELNRTEPLADLYCHTYLNTCQRYDATVESMGVDIIRVKYRQQRRNVIEQVIRNNLQGDKIDSVIAGEMHNINEKDFNQFKNVVHEDLAVISKDIIGGMGITSEELERWKKDKKR
jgi:Fic family protein